MRAAPLRPDSLAFTALLGVLAALPALSIDINAPSLLLVQQQFLAPSGLVGLTITLFMAGFALGQLGAGPISDRWGRRPVLLAGLTGYTAAALGCTVALSLQALVGWRLLQGVGAGACSVLAFTIITDLFDGDVARSKRSYVTVVFGLAPMLAPSLGAWMLDHGGWRPIYLILALGGIAMLVAVGWGMTESRAAEAGDRKRVPVVRTYGRVLRDRRFVGLAAVNALSFGGMFAYIAGSPLVLMGTFGLSGPEYGVIFACTAAALTAGAWVSGRCARAGVRARRLLWLSLTTAAASAIALTILLMIGAASLPLITLMLLLNLFCRGIVAPNAQHLALQPIREDAGSAAAAVGVMQILIGAISSAIVAMLLPLLGPLGMSAVMAAFALGSLLLWTWISVTPEPYGVDRAVAVAEPGV